MKRKIDPVLRAALIVFCCAAAAVLALLLFRPAGPDDSAYPVTVHFIDVGQGDATLIRTPEGNILIDAGSNLSEESLLVYLDSLDVTRLDLLVLTHLHEDHIGGADAVLSLLEVDTLVMPEASDEDRDTVVSRRMKDHVKSGTQIRTVTEATEFKGGTVDVIILPTGAGGSEGNASSLVVRVSTGDTAFLIMGDTEMEGEDALLAEYGGTGLLGASVLRVGHHGSSTSTGGSFLDTVAPDAAVISVEAGNSYGHPTDRVLSALRDRGITVYRTDLDGTVVLGTDGKTVVRIAPDGEK